MFNSRIAAAALLVVCFVIVAAIGQNLRHKGNFAYVTIQASDDLTLTFLRQHLRSREACEAAAESFAALMIANCPVCRISRQECLRELSTEQSTLFGDAPVHYATARLHNGVMAYLAKDPQVSLGTCRLSEQRSPSGLVICSAPDTPRPLPAKLRESFEKLESAFFGIAWFVAATILTLAVYLAWQWRRRRWAVASARSPYNPWPAKIALAAGDALVMLGTFLAIAWPNSPALGGLTPIERNTLLIHAGLIGITLLWFWAPLEHYSRRRPFWDELRETIRVIAAMFMIAGGTIFITGAESTLNIQLSLWLCNLLLMPLARACARSILDALGLWQMPTMIIGAGTNAGDAAAALADEMSMGYQVIAFVDVSGGAAPANGVMQFMAPVVHCSRSGTTSLQQELERLLAEYGQPQIVIALDSLNMPESQRVVQYLSASARNIHIIPAIRGLPLFGTQVSHFFSHEVLFLTVRNNLSRRAYRWTKRGFDLLGAGILLLLLSPLFLVLTALIRGTGGTAFYAHPRVGRNGKPFNCLKFRSMRPDADQVLNELLDNDPDARAEWDRDFKLRNDPRVTSVGGFLRRTSLDELPQLINVIKGEMSLVGPRPIVAAELERYGDYVSLYLQVLPGVTGLWQISGRNDTSYNERVSLDAWYVQNWSLWYDIAILFKTIDVVLNKRGVY